MNEKTLKEYLEQTTKDELIKKMKIIGFKYAGLNKPEIANILNEYLLNENHIDKIWNSLNPFEKEYLEEFLKYDEKPSYKIMDNLYKKYEIKRSYFGDPWEQKSAMNVLFTNSMVPGQLKKLLAKYLTPIAISYDIKDEIPVEGKNTINVVGESFAVDFSNVISLVNSIGLALTKEKGILSKGSIVKINSVLFNKEIVFQDIGSIDRASSIESTGRIYAVFMLMAESGMLLENNRSLNISNEANTFLGLKIEDKCKYILRYYLNSKRIYELSRIVESVFKAERKGNMTECRNIIIKHLKNCPVGKWVPVSQFVDYIKMKDKKFLVNQVGDITYYSHKFRMYLEPWVEWEQLEGRFVEVVLHEYLATMGIVDTVIQESEGGCWDYEDRPFFKVEYFRITSLGAYVLGITQEYEYKEQTIKSGFTVEEDSHIKIMNQLSNQVHNIFFEGFAAKEEYPEYCVFKISFGAIAKALDRGITVENIVGYIREHSYNGLTEELHNLLLKWKENINKVVIKNVMIVQAEDSALIEELKSDPNLKKYMIDDLSCAFQINSDSAMKVKREIEKKEYYCKLLKEQ